MFDLGMTELMLIGLVALLVLGPEKLPRAARTAGMYLRKARQTWYSMRTEIERELAAEEFKRSIRDSKAAIGDSLEQLQDSAQNLERKITGQVPPSELALESTRSMVADADADAAGDDADQAEPSAVAAVQATDSIDRHSDADHDEPTSAGPGTDDALPDQSGRTRRHSP